MKQEISKKKSKPKSIKKNLGLFDHLKAIRYTKDPNYYNNLSESEKKSFSHWMILTWLSLDDDLLDLIKLLFTDGYYDKIPSDMFYKMLVDFVPKSYNNLSWIKTTRKSEKLLTELSRWFSVSKRESEEYLNIMLSSDVGLIELSSILEGLGFSDEESEELLNISDKKSKKTAE